MDIPLDTLGRRSSRSSARPSIIEPEHTHDLDIETPRTESNLVFESSHPSQSLAPTDRGRQAWSFLVAATLIETIVWGLPFSVGVLHEYWINEKFAGQGQEGTLTTAATLQSGLMYMLSIVQGPLLQAYPHRRTHLSAFGLLAGTAGFIGSAFVTEAWHLVVTLGIIYPISGFLYLPAATLLFEWFVERRGLAAGIMFSGTGVGGFVFPFTMRALIQHLGYKAGMCCVAAGYAVIGGASLFFIKPRVPVRAPGPNPSQHPKASMISTISRTIRGKGAVKLDFLTRSTFYAFIGNNLLSSMANFLPAVYIPSYAHDLGMTKPDGTVLLALMNAASIPGLLLLGYLSDKTSLRLVISLSCFGTALSCICLWGFATSTGMLIAFVVMFGLLGLSFSALWTKLITVIAQDDPTLPPLLFSIFAFSRGIGNVSSGPVSTALLKYDSMKGSIGGYGQGHYGPLLVYTGVMMTLGGVCGIVYRTRA